MLSSVRALALGVVAALLMALGWSCVNLYELEGYSGATQGLCSKLTECFGEGYVPACRDFTDPRLSGAPSAERQAWLVMFADSNCLESCASARACLDNQPICGIADEACGKNEHCCGFTSGAGRCDPAGCCKPLGNACTTDGECCDADCLAANDGERFCGGVACDPPGASCEDSFECCTQICIDGECADTTCLPKGGACSVNAECCEGFCNLGELAEDGAIAPGTCATPICQGDGARCEDPAECCGGFCVQGSVGPAVCSGAACLPDQAQCDPDMNSQECCSLVCNPDFERCEPACAEPGGACDFDSDCCDGNCDESFGECACRADGALCAEHDDCCTNVCSDQFTCGDTMCLLPGSPCVPGDSACCTRCQADNRGAGMGAACCEYPGCTHSVCIVGAPLLPSCTCNECPDGALAADCITNVCDALPHCCCFGWDDTCVQAASQCGPICPILDIEVEGATPLPKP